MNKYKTTQEVRSEWISEGSKGDFDVFIKNKLKPKDPLFEKWSKFYKDTYDSAVIDDEECKQSFFVRFKEIFSDELNGTVGLDEAIKFFKERKDNANSSGIMVECTIAISHLTDIKARMKI